MLTELVGDAARAVASPTSSVSIGVPVPISSATPTRCI